jgi:hypothetical protein
MMAEMIRPGQLLDAGPSRDGGDLAYPKVTDKPVRRRAPGSTPTRTVGKRPKGWWPRSRSQTCGAWLSVFASGYVVRGFDHSESEA